MDILLEKKSLMKFCQKNNVQLVFRGNQVFPEGIRKFFDTSFISFFSATDYVTTKIQARYIEMNSDDIYNYNVYEIRKDLQD